MGKHRDDDHEEDAPYFMIFEISHVNSHNRNGQFQSISEIHLKGESVKIQEFILVIIFDSFHQKWHFMLKNESFEISRNSANV